MVWALRSDSTRQRWLKGTEQWWAVLRRRPQEQWSVADYQAIRRLVGGPSWEQMQQVFRQLRERHTALWRLPERVRNRVLAEYVRRVSRGIQLGIPRPSGSALPKGGTSQGTRPEGSGKTKQKHGQTSLQSLPPSIATPPCHPAERNAAWNNCEEQYLFALPPAVIHHVWTLISRCAFTGTIGCVLLSFGSLIAFGGAGIYSYARCIQSVKDQYGDFGCEFEYYYDEQGGWWYEPLYPRGNPPPGWPGGQSGGGSSCVPVYVNGELMGFCCANTVFKMYECAKRYGDLN